VLRRIFGHQTEKERGAAEGYIMRSFITCMLHEILLGRSNQGGWDGWGMQHGWEK